MKTDTPQAAPGAGTRPSPGGDPVSAQSFPQPGPSGGVADPRRGGNRLQSSLNWQGRAARRSVKSPARPYFSHEFPLAPSSDCISAAHTAGLEFQLFSLSRLS
ncbi:hypothetical protein VULLAG_LOCUS3518 [Vulpes lagopus]